MAHSNDSQRSRRTRRQFTAAVLVLLASVAWVQQVRAADPRSAQATAPGRRGAGQVFALAIDPHIPTTLYAGTCFGVLKSLDGGDSWQAAGTGLPITSSCNECTQVTPLVIDPENPTTLYAASTGKVFKSTDGGNTWSASGLTNDYASALVIDPNTPATLYAGTTTTCGPEKCGRGGVFKSTDGASSWQAVNTGLPPEITDVRLLGLAIAATTPATLYLYSAFDDFGMFRSTDAGATWTVSGPANTGVSAMAIDPKAPATLYATGITPAAALTAAF